jgi:predicted Zn-dependent peptidase
VSPRPLAEQKPGTTRTLISGHDGAVVRRTVLPGGLRVITEAMPTVRSVSFGVWVGVGSRDETPALAGSSHYLEHVLFKGTKRRDALEISAALDAVGGEMNAFTSKEYTCFYARVLDNDLPLAVDVISDMMTSSVVRTSDVDSERGVILEEIAMHEDDPGDVVHDTFAEALFGDTPLGRPILGTVASINALQRTAINGYYRRRYRPENMVIAVAGNLDHAKVVRLVAKAFREMLTDDAQIDRLPSPPRVGGRPPVSRSGVSLVQRQTEQAHLVLGVPALSRVDERRFALGVLNGALGGGMSSRLFQEIREKRGLAYSVFSYVGHHAETGMFGVYAGCQPAKAAEVLSICRDQLDLVARSGITAEELTRGKGQLAGSLVLGLEDTGSRMSRLGKAELVYGEIQTVDELLARISSVTLDDVRDIAREVLSAKQTLAVIGPFDQSAFADAVA